jgi:hypothetical protein
VRHIAGEHAANPISAIAERQAATLAAGLQVCGQAVINLADENAQAKLPSGSDLYQPLDSQSQTAHLLPRADAAGGLKQPVRSGRATARTPTCKR